MSKAILDCDVVICGAGPVGLTAALKLARHGISSHILEKRDVLNSASKASTFHPPTLEILEEFGLLDVMVKEGCKAERIAYLRIDGEQIAEFNQPASLKDDTSVPYRVHLEQSAITPHLLSEALKTGLVKITFASDVQEVGQDDTSTWAKTSDGTTVKGQYILGADGAQSSVRRSLGFEQEGSKYPGCVLRLIVDKSLKSLLPKIAPVSYIYSESLKAISLLEMPDCWRIIIRVPEEVSEDEARKPDWYNKIVNEFLPACGGRLNILGTDVYGASKMIAISNRVGRIGLIGDAVHLTNTKGGMNMNCGIHDAYAVACSLIEELGSSDPDCQAFENTLRDRFTIASEVLLPRTDKNVTGKDDWLEFIANAAADPQKARDYLLTSSMLDMAPKLRSVIV